MLPREMNLYILEYMAAYTGGALIIIAEDEEKLEEIIAQAGYDYVKGERDRQLFTIRNTPFNKKGYEKSFVLDALKHLPLIEKELLLKIEECSYDTGRVRMDWLSNEIELKEGVYLVKSYEVTTWDYGIISNTYYCA